ncbi:protein kinase [Psychrosphaera sp. 1_MG-2023]|uniref:protein kinase domain-containing protein n=1 Tax=unclassified Psychrosphaera TaxID=2641570 RepID=UPI0020911354|nr:MULTISPECIES: protein kinase [unclassified Psychrosphaera]MDO6717994.1 protein kinase [Psychrosphaera sp. 1_MG-2023]
MEINLKNFYISDEQSIYLLAANDAKKLRDWVALCQTQLQKMGYQQVHLIGKGAYGFVFVGTDKKRNERVFKFSRITLPQAVRERLEEEGYMLGLLDHPSIPKYIAFESIKKQGILVMQRGQGVDLHELSRSYGRLPVYLIIKIAEQLADILVYLRSVQIQGANGQLESRPIVHGDIKPSNLLWDEHTQKLSLVDWGSSVFAQLDTQCQPIVNNVMELMSADMQNTNSRLGDVYFIGNDQLNGGLSSPRFDEQGAAATLYALASNQNCRYGVAAIPTNSLCLPKAFSDVLSDMLSDDVAKQHKAGDTFITQIKHLKNWVLSDTENYQDANHLPIWTKVRKQNVETVVYSSRKSFLRQHQADAASLDGIKDAQLDKYYKNYLQGMGENEKAFVAAVSRLNEFPIVGGFAIHWLADKISVESNLNLFDVKYQVSVGQTIDNIIDLARSLELREGIFKACLFDAKNTLHFERENEHQPFYCSDTTHISFEITPVPETDDNKQHSYFEDGDDPDEKLALPEEIMQHIVALNNIRHTGCIIFEALPKHLKIHNYYTLLDESQYLQFKHHLSGVLANIKHIKGIGVSGFMKLPYKDTKSFSYQTKRPELYCNTLKRLTA